MSVCVPWAERMVRQLTISDGGMGSFQEGVAAKYVSRGYTDNLKTLGLGLSEETGELCAAILDVSPDFQPSDHRQISDLRHELYDVLTYLSAIANAANIKLI